MSSAVGPVMRTTAALIHNKYCLLKTVFCKELCFSFLIKIRAKCLIFLPHQLLPLGMYSDHFVIIYIIFLPDC